MQEEYTLSDSHEQGIFCVSEEETPPLAICHISPVHSVSLFPGVAVRDLKTKEEIEEEKKRKAALPLTLLEREKQRIELAFQEQEKKRKAALTEEQRREEEKSVRGRVIGLSPRSRGRLQVQINKYKFKLGHVWFQTLTYPTDFPSPDVAKQHLENFRKRLKRKFGGCGGKIGLVWRIENQQRGAPHFHLIIFLSKLIPVDVFSVWALKAWFEVIGSSNKHSLVYGCRTEPLRCLNGVAAYCSKYVSKPEEGERVTFIMGRQWGVMGEFPEERIRFEFTEENLYRFWRIARRSRGKKGNARPKRSIRRQAKKLAVLRGRSGPMFHKAWKNFFIPGFNDEWLRLACLYGIQVSFEAENFYQ